MNRETVPPQEDLISSERDREALLEYALKTHHQPSRLIDIMQALEGSRASRAEDMSRRHKTTEQQV